MPWNLPGLSVSDVLRCGSCHEGWDFWAVCLVDGMSDALKIDFAP